MLLDTSQSMAALIYVFDLGKHKGKAILKIDYEMKVKDEDGKKRRIQTNIIRTGNIFVYDEKMEQGFANYDVIFGEIKK